MRNRALIFCILSFVGCTFDFDKFRFQGEGGGSTGGMTTSSTGGESTSSSTTNTGGDPTSTSSSGGGGQGGSTTNSSSSNTGGGGSPPTGCEAGEQETPSLLEGWGNTESASLLILEDGSSEFQYNDLGGESNKLSYTLTNVDKFPGQLVLSGLDGIHARLTAGGTDRPQEMYFVQGSAIPYIECSDLGLYSEDCLALIAKDYRCQNGSGESDCPTPELNYSTQNAQAIYDLNVDAVSLVLLVDIVCQP